MKKHVELLKRQSELKKAIPRLKTANLELYNFIADLQNEIITMIRTAPGLAKRPLDSIDNFKNILSGEKAFIDSQNSIDEAYFNSLMEQNTRLIAIHGKLVSAKADLKILLPQIERKIENRLKDKVILKTEAEVNKARGNAMIATRKVAVEFLDKLITSFPQQNSTNALAAEQDTHTKRQ
jgi:hypothetical protein